MKWGEGGCVKAAKVKARQGNVTLISKWKVACSVSIICNSWSGILLKSRERDSAVGTARAARGARAAASARGEFKPSIVNAGNASAVDGISVGAAQ